VDEAIHQHAIKPVAKQFNFDQFWRNLGVGGRMTGKSEVNFPIAD
jgi:hypothetical protein